MQIAVLPLSDESFLVTEWILGEGKLMTEESGDERGKRP